MEDQTNPELPVEMVQPEDEELVNPQQPLPPGMPPKMPIIIPVVGMLVVIVIIALAVTVIAGMTRKNKRKVPATVPTIAQSKQNSSKSISLPSIPETDPTPILVNLPPESLPLILEVSALGGGALGDKREYTVNAKLTEDDKLFVLQRSEVDITTYPGYVKGAVDTGLRIVHKNTFIEVIPVFEGVGIPFFKKVKTEVIKNKTLTDKPIYRLDMAEIQTPAYQPDKNGFVYTTQYIENVQSCSVFSPEPSKPPYPACISGGMDVDLKESGPVTITCYGENADVAWCDSLVKSLTISQE